MVRVRLLAMISTARDVTPSSVPASKNDEFNSGAYIGRDEHPGPEVYCGETKEAPRIAGYDDGYDTKEHAR
jgi:hypothetical protein